MKVHFIAIGGSAMHNLAIAMHLKGYTVTGSDDEIFDPAKSRLQRYGLLPDSYGWHPERITNDLDAIVLGMHARADNPELLRKLKVLKFCLEKNGLAYNFKPQDVKIKVNMGYTTITLSLPCRFSFLHGKYDSVVPYDNLQSIYNKWGENAAKYIRCTSFYDHGDMGKAFFLVEHDEMVEEMLEGRWKAGTSTFETDIPKIINDLMN